MSDPAPPLDRPEPAWPHTPVSLAEAPETLAARTLLAAVRMRDPALADHGLRTGQVAAAISAEMGASADEVDRAYLGALLHDVGKLAIPEEVLSKPGPLNAAEWDRIRTHPERGHELVAPLVDDEVAAVVLHHHERVDGEGYPYRAGLKTLPMTVRIVQVADAYDAMTSPRPYAPAVSPAEALVEIARCSGTQFDPEVAAVLRDLLHDGAGAGTVSLLP